MLAAGLDGIERDLTPPPPVNEDVYDFGERDLRERAIGTLPGTLAEALDALEQDEVIQEALGSSRPFCGPSGWSGVSIASR
jgi:glutamine synthetase